MAAIQNTLHVSEHSPDGKLYAYINFDGKLKIWDTETSELRQEFVAKAHLSVPYTCFTFLNVDNAVVSRKTSPKKQPQQQTTPFIALGTKNGGVSLYSFATGDLERNLTGAGHQGSVTGICRGTNNTLYTCGEDCRVVVWSLESGGQISSWDIGSEKPSSLVYLTQTNRLMVAGRQLHLWNIENEELEQTFVGHPTNVTILRYIVIKSKEFVLSASKTDRILNLWRIKKEVKKASNAISFLMEDIAYGITHHTDATDGKVNVAAVTRSGVLHLYSFDNSAKGESGGKTPIRPSITIEIANDSAQVVEPIPIVTASLEYSHKSNTVQIAYGDRQRLRFELLEPETNEKRQVFIRADPKKSFANDTGSETKTKAGSNLKTISPLIETAKVEYQTNVIASRKGQKIIEIPMETRLENLTFGSAADSKQARNIAQLLVQALHSHEANLLRMVFTNKDEQVIRSTLQRLPPQYVGSLVTELTQLAQKKSTNAHIAVMWLRNLVQTHASQLMAIGNVELYSQFGPLLGVIEHRANSLQQLSKLSGRLDLLVSQIKQNTDRDIVQDTNLLVYEDQDSSDSEALPNNIDESSEDQWDETEEEEEVEEDEKMDVVEEEDDGDNDSTDDDDEYFF